MVVKRVVESRQRESSVDLKQRLIDRVFNSDVADEAVSKPGLRVTEGCCECGILKELIPALAGPIRRGDGCSLARQECGQCGGIDTRGLGAVISEPIAEVAGATHV
jgi:hypothetical protein